MLSIRTIFSALLLCAMTPPAFATDASKTAVVAAPTAVPKTPAAEAMRSPTKVDLRKLKTLDSKYQNTKSISMQMQKDVKAALLDQETKSSGRLLISKGRMRMEIDPPNESLIVINKKDIWIVNPPPAEFKDTPTQVAKLSASSKKGQSQSFLGLLMGGGFSKFFKVLNVAEQNGELTYFLAPSKSSFDVTRAQLTLAQGGKEIKGLRFWDERNNETYFEFSKVETGKKVSDDKFNYIPPKNAQISTM